jgi:hypothetical protein
MFKPKMKTTQTGHGTAGLGTEHIQKRDAFVGVRNHGVMFCSGRNANKNQRPRQHHQLEVSALIDGIQVGRLEASAIG